MSDSAGVTVDAAAVAYDLPFVPGVVRFSSHCAVQPIIYYLASSGQEEEDEAEACFASISDLLA